MTLELVVPARASPTKGAIEAVGESLRDVFFRGFGFRASLERGRRRRRRHRHRSNDSLAPCPIQLFVRFHLREDDIVVFLVAEEEEAWEPRERFIFALRK